MKMETLNRQNVMSQWWHKKRFLFYKLQMKKKNLFTELHYRVFRTTHHRSCVKYRWILWWNTVNNIFFHLECQHTHISVHTSVYWKLKWLYIYEIVLRTIFVQSIHLIGMWLFVFVVISTITWFVLYFYTYFSSIRVNVIYSQITKWHGRSLIANSISIV